MTTSPKPDGRAAADTPQPQPGRPEPALTSEDGHAVRRSFRRTPKALGAAVSAQPLSRQQEEIWEKAVAYCVRQLPTLWTAGAPQPPAGSGTHWIVPIVLCYPDGYEAKLGEMVFDEQAQDFTLVTDKPTLAERARIVAASRPRHAKKAATPEAGA